MKGQEKRKTEADGNEQYQRRGGRTEAPKLTYHSETQAYLRTSRTQTYLGKETTHEIRDPWGLVG